jgi:hypothetical protein
MAGLAGTGGHRTGTAWQATAGNGTAGVARRGWHRKGVARPVTAWRATEWQERMTQPTNADEYLKRVKENQSLSGHGADTTLHMPCPFCGAAEFMTYAIGAMEAVTGKGATCKECGRSARFLYEHHHDRASFEIVQTGGPDQPQWLIPKMRRTS